MTDHDTDPYADAGFIAATQPLWHEIETSPAALLALAEKLEGVERQANCNAFHALRAVAAEKESEAALAEEHHQMLSNVFAERDSLRALNAELVAALNYVRNIVPRTDCDVDYVDAIIAKAEAQP